MLKEEEYWFWYCSLTQVGPAVRNQLRKRFESPAAIYNIKKEEMERALLPFHSSNAVERVWKQMGSSREEEKIHRDFERMKQLGIRLVTAEAPDFPNGLLTLPDCPPGLFVKGELPDGEKPAAAIVGSRECSYYGRNTARELGKTLAGAEVQVISGLARGIDAAGHEGALEAGGKTFGILGCGPDVVYPRENQFLYEQVAKAGGLLSEYPPGTRPEGWHFPARNRIISGLSDCIVVVEAGVKSGSLITASMALEQGKDIWAVPGRMGDFLSRGTNRLLRDGAMPLTAFEDILGSWNFVKKRLRIYKKTRLSLDKNTEKVYSYLDSDLKSEEQLCIESGLDGGIVAASLVELELEGLAVQPFRHYYAAKRDKGEQYGEVSGDCRVPCKGKDHKKISGAEL
ncbi:MAG: DNA-protecting protein DprA [Lachnospiraceae bacterium]|nr:DNA-protecting protein DprA [Lachnospiraceae bacterium]